ncbi:Hsp70 family chaperone [Lithospermum erythrorhizon]|uniref:Hsp70 family chaperone n=1 Tax=Lithospermum erythrorhizon TaxID=34254 RepID=A0AAV3PS49_LITER
MKSFLFQLTSTLSIFLLLINLQSSESAVVSIDLGSEWLKVAVVNLKPGQAPISIAINEMSKRKTPSLVALESNTRLIGEEATNLLARYPTKVFYNPRDFISKPYNYAIARMKEFYLSNDVFLEENRGVVGFRTDLGEFGAEELVAMVLRFGMGLGEGHVRGVVREAVLTVPPYMGVAERKGLLLAAELAGIKVLALVNEHCGAALQYGIDKDFTEESRFVVFYDMGAASTYAALVYFSSYSAKEFGKTISVNQFQVKDVRWDAELGGQDMELRLVEYFADEFNKQLGNGFDVRTSPKAMAKLKKQVKRTKEILSANTMALISVESIHDDRDFRSTITREKFEELCQDIWERALNPLREVIKHSGLKPEEIYAVELIGGATRVPKLKAKLQEFVGRKELDKHLDADEAIVLGASLHAANISDGIKLNRKLGMIDGSTYGYMMHLDGPDLEKDENTQQLIVPRMKKIPSKMFRSIVHNKDFEVTLSYESEGLLPPGVTSSVFAQYSISGLAEAAERYGSRNLSAPIKASLHFSLSRSSVLSLDRADAVIEISEWVEVPKKNLTVDNSTSSSNNTSEARADGGKDDSSESTENGSTSKDPDTEKKLKKRTFRSPLKITEKTMGPSKSLSEESLTDARRKLEALDKKDAERRRTAELKNNLESYIYATREKLDSEEFEKISSSEERKSFIEKLEEAQDWLYMDGEDASADEFQERLDKLKSIGDPIFFRYNEVTARPAAAEHARKYFDEVERIVQKWKTDKSWLAKAKIDEVQNDAEKLRKWLNEKEAEQKKTPGFNTPVFTSDEIYDKVINLQDKVSRVNRIPKPKPIIEKPVKNETEKSDDKENTHTPSSDESSTPTDQGSSDSDKSNDNAKSETEVHDEL